MAPDNKKKHVVSYENMSDEVATVFNTKYPHGFSDYLPDTVKYSPGINPKTQKMIEPFYAVTIETETDIYLVKIKVEVDDAEDIERWLEGEEEAKVEQVAGAMSGDSSGDDTLPDDNIAQYSGADEDSSDSN